MKFNKDEVIEELKKNLKKDHLFSDRTITETVENLLVFAGEEIELSDFVIKAKRSLETFDGNLRAELAKYEKEKAERERTSQTEAEKEAARKKAEEDAKAGKTDESKGLTIEEVQKMLDERDAKHRVEMEKERVKAERQAKINAARDLHLKGFKSDIVENIKSPAEDADDEAITKHYAGIAQTFRTAGIPFEESYSTEKPGTDTAASEIQKAIEAKNVKK